MIQGILSTEQCIHAGMAIGRSLYCRGFVVGKQGTVEHAILVRVDPVVFGIHMKSGRGTGDVGSGATGGAVDEIVPDQVALRKALGIAHDVAIFPPVVEDRVDELVGAPRLGVAGLVVDVQRTNHRPLPALHQSAGGVVAVVDALPDDTILKGQVVNSGTIDIKRTIAAPGDGHVVKEVVLPAGDADGVLAAVPVFAHPDADVADDVVARAGRQRNAVAIEGNATAGSRLASYRDILTDDDAVADVDDPTHVKDYRPIWLAHRITKRARAAVIEIGHVVHGAAASARGIFTEALRPRKAGLLSLGDQ